MRLRQVALVAADLASACADIRAVFGVDHAYADPGVAKYGLDNAVFPIGDTFLEVVSPNCTGTAAGRLLEKRRGDGGYMVILQVDDLAGARARVAACGVRVVDQIDRDKASFTHLHPKDVGGAILSIDAMRPADHWEWGGPDWRAHSGAGLAAGLVGAAIQADDPARVAARWGEVLGRNAVRDGAGFCIALDEGVLRFVAVADGRGEGVGGFEVAVRDGDSVRAAARGRGLIDAAGDLMICGARVRLVA